MPLQPVSSPISSHLFLPLAAFSGWFWWWLDGWSDGHAERYELDSYLMVHLWRELSRVLVRCYYGM